MVVLHRVDVFALALIVSSFVTTGCQKPNEYQPPPPPPVSVSKPLVQTVTMYHEETGTTEAVQKVEIRARVRGFLEEIRFEPGADVKQGDVLFVIEQRQYQASVASAEAALQAANVGLEKAEIELVRQETLFKDNATAELNVVAARAERDSSKASVAAMAARLDQAKLNLEYTEVRSPIDGRVGKAFVKLGNLVDETAATHMTTVIQYNPIYANFNISESVFLRLVDEANSRGRESRGKDLPLFLRRDTDEGFPFEGVFDYADLAVDQSTGTYMIRGIFPNDDLKIVPGLFVRVRIPAEVREDALLVPELALGADQGGRFALVVNDENEVERRNVTVGTKVDDLMVIESGLDKDERVIVKGIQRARPGAKVSPTESGIAAEQAGTETAASESNETEAADANSDES